MQNDTAIERALRNPSHGGGVGTYEVQVQWIASSKKRLFQSLPILTLSWYAQLLSKARIQSLLTGKHLIHSRYNKRNTVTGLELELTGACESYKLLDS